MNLISLTDANSFYASAQAAFEMHLRGKPLVVLSNCDGSIIARSREAKSIGIGMGVTFHSVRSMMRTHGLQVRSANFALYGDLSARIVAIMRDRVPALSVYSIDETFSTLPVGADPATFGLSLIEEIERGTGIPCCYGAAVTHTLAKLANKIAKKGARVVVLDTAIKRAAALADFPVADVWGVGRKYAARLNDMQIHTAGDLAAAHAPTIRASFGVVLERTVQELRGRSCQVLETVEPQRQQIMVSRSFGRDVTTAENLHEALANFVTRAAVQLRKRGLAAQGVLVHASSNPFRESTLQYHPQRAVNLPVATSDTCQLLGVSRALLRSMYRDGICYKRVGVMLLDLVPANAYQTDLLTEPKARASDLMSTLDAVNTRFGRGSLGFAAQGWRQSTAWAPRQEYLSGCFTTRWADLPRAR